MIVKIAGMPYTVIGVHGSKAVSHEVSGNNLYGEISYLNSSIRIDVDNTIERTNQTFWHEVIHGMIEGYRIRELMDKQGNHLEHPIDQLATGIFNVLNDNFQIKVITHEDILK